jgi:hypothetical protein
MSASDTDATINDHSLSMLRAKMSMRIRTFEVSEMDSVPELVQ